MWEKSQDLFNKDATPVQINAALASLNEYDRQMMILMKKSMKNSFGAALRNTIDAKIRAGEIEDEVWTILQVVKHDKERLGDAIAKKADGDFVASSWPNHRGSLDSWVAKLRLIARDLGKKYPEGVAREIRIRDKIFENLKSGVNSECDLIISRCKLKEVDTPEGSIPLLVEELTKQMYIVENNTEKQCTVFANIVPNSTNTQQGTAYLTHAEQSNLKNPNHPSFVGHTAGNTANDPNNTNTPNNSANSGGNSNPNGPTINVNLGYNGKGKGKGNNGGWQGNGNWNNNSDWNTYNRNNNANKPPANKWCRHCEKHYKDTKVPVKEHVCSSHWDKDCTFFKRKQNENGDKNKKGGGKGKGVQKPFDKKKKGKGKGKKGKKGKGRNGGY